MLVMVMMEILMNGGEEVDGDDGVDGGDGDALTLLGVIESAAARRKSRVLFASFS